jgi:outer membrane immunogenic protein
VLNILLITQGWGWGVRNYFLGCLAFVALGTASASAADLAVKTPIYKAAPAPIVDMWTGFYVGANVGYGWGGWDASSNQRVFNFETTTASPNVKGVAAGIQAGYNWRVNPQWVVGIEADIEDPLSANQVWTDPGIAVSVSPPSDFVPRPGGPASLSHDWKLRWFGTVRLRAGVTPVENWLFYVTGGPAIGGSRYSFDFGQPGAAAIPAPTTYALSTNKTTYGYSVGAGAETKLTTNWSVKFEYLYLDLGKVSIDTLDIDGFPFHVDYRLRSHLARIGLNYKFDWGKGVVAKY